MQQARQIDLIKRMLGHVEANRKDLAAELGHADTAIYTDPLRFEREVATFYRRYPIVVGFSAQLRKAGDFITHNQTGQPILVVRQADGDLRAFLNVCRHRGAAVETAASGCKRAFVCGYHGWTYDGDGRLRAITEPEGFAGSDAAIRGLRRLALAEKYGMVWVVPTALAEDAAADAANFDIDAYLGPLAEDLAGWTMDDWPLFNSVPSTPAMNWKLVVDTFLEAYHFRFLHARSVSPLFLDHYAAYDRIGPHVRICVAKKTMPDLRGVPESQWRLRDHALVLHVIFPNTVLAWVEDHCGIFTAFPDQVARSTMFTSLLVDPGRRDGKPDAYWQANADLLRTATGEDFALGETAQRGFTSGANKQIMFGRNEAGLTYYHQAVEAAMAAPATAGGRS